MFLEEVFLEEEFLLVSFRGIPQLAACRQTDGPERESALRKRADGPQKQEPQCDEEPQTDGPERSENKLKE